MEHFFGRVIVLQHALVPDIEALPLIIQAVKKRGYRVETLRKGIRTSV